MSTETQEKMNDSQVGLLDSGGGDKIGESQTPESQQIELIDVSLEEGGKKDEAKETELAETNEDEEGKKKEAKKQSSGMRSWFKSPKRSGSKPKEEKQELTTEANGEAEKQEEAEKDGTGDEASVEPKKKKEGKASSLTPNWLKFEKKPKKENVEEGTPDGMTELNGDGGVESESKKKVKKEKKKKEPGECCPTFQVNLLDRDENRINDAVRINFDDVLAEPDGSHSVDGVWRLTNKVFVCTKYWLYRIITALLALPCGIFCGVQFALLTVIHVWLVSPLLKVYRLFMFWIGQIFAGLLSAFVAPCWAAIGQLFSSIHVHHSGTLNRIHDA